MAHLLHFTLVLIALYFYASLVLGFFPWTRGYAQLLVGYILSPLQTVRHAFVAYLPNVFFIAVIMVISFYFTRFTRIIFTEIGKQTINFPGFYPEWAEPTYKIVRFLILILTVIVIFPYLPGSDSSAFRGISIFLGVLFSLGSTSAVANVVAGVILTYMRAFKLGDRVKIADTMGDVIEKTLLVTRIRTIKNVEITIANAMVLSAHIINFSASAQQQGLILHTTVTIGYDAPWRTVHELLIAAAVATENILTEPQPYVLQTALDDFYVHYELNAFTGHPSRMAVTYSELHKTSRTNSTRRGWKSCHRIVPTFETEIRPPFRRTTCQRPTLLRRSGWESWTTRSSLKMRRNPPASRARRPPTGPSVIHMRSMCHPPRLPDRAIHLDSRLLSRLRRPVGRFNAELPGVLGVQSLPAELHGLGADDAADGSSAEKAIQNIETNVPPGSAHGDEAAIDVGPQRQARAATKGFEFPPHIEATPLYSSTLGASARVTVVSVTCGVGAPTVVSFTVAPTVPRLPSASKGAHSRRCAGSVSACQTFSGEWRSSRTRMSVHFSPSVFRTCAPLAGPGVYCSRSVIFFSLA